MIKKDDYIYNEGKICKVLQVKPNNFCIISSNDDTKMAHIEAVNEIENVNDFTIIPRYEDSSTIDGSVARQLAAKILEDSPFTEQNYYDLEDHITNVLLGKESKFPTLYFYKLNLRQNVESCLDVVKMSNDIDNDVISDDNLVDLVVDEIMSWDDEPTTDDIVDEIKRQYNLEVYSVKFDKETEGKSFEEKIEILENELK